MYVCFLCWLIVGFLYSGESSALSQQAHFYMQEQILNENQLVEKQFDHIAKFYELGAHEQIREITQQVLSDSETNLNTKQSILQQGRRLFVFYYPSDGLKVKGFISFTPKAQHQPMIVLLRPGNREWALLHPGMDLISYKDYTVLSTTYRGGVSEGKEEFGGADIHDIKNLMDFIPSLARLLNISLQPCHLFMLGVSRGGMELFLTLAHYPSLQKQVDKIVSLSGILDMDLLIQERSDMRDMFKESFGFIEGVNERQWIDRRNPILTVPLIKKSLPILIIQGTDDKRVQLEEGYHMVKKLHENGNPVTYWEIPQGTHMLSSTPNRMQLIVNWLESDPQIASHC